MNLFIKNIHQLVTMAAHGARATTGPAMQDIGLLHDAGVLCRDGMIAWVGPMASVPEELSADVPELDASNMVVLPGFVDAHTHMMYAGDRAEEFGMRARGATYQQIAEQGGGILKTIQHVRAASRKELKRSAGRHLAAMMKLGTTTVEIKTGYGLAMDAEVKMLEAIHDLRNEELATIVPTFLGAHAVPPEFREDSQAYVRLVTETMIPYVGRRALAKFCDVFCERGYFTLEQSEEVLQAGVAAGMLPKIHAEELGPLGGALLAGRVKAVSADHLEHITDEGIAALRDGGVVAVLLPGVSFFLNHGYAPARSLIDAGVPVALATDFNPGSCMSYSMPLMMTIACTHMQMTPEEALTACTVNGAAALNLSATHGSIEPGKRADVIVADVPDYRHLAYHFGTNHIVHTIVQGTLLEIP